MFERLGARLRLKFDWRCIADMINAYLDHRCKTTLASRIFFAKRRIQAHVAAAEEDDTSDSKEEAETPNGS